MHDTIFKIFLVIFVAGEALIVFRIFVFSFEPVYPLFSFGPVKKAESTFALQTLPGEMLARYRNRAYGFTLNYPVFGNWPAVTESEAKDGTYLALGNWIGKLGAKKEESFLLYVRDNSVKTSFKNWFVSEVDPKGILAKQGSVIVADLANHWKLRYISKPFPKGYLTDQADSSVPVCRYYLTPPSANYFLTLCPGASLNLSAHGFDSTFEQKFMMDIANSLNES